MYGDNIQSCKVFTERDLKHSSVDEWMDKPLVKYFAMTRQIDLPKSFVRVSNLKEADLIILSSECTRFVWRKKAGYDILYPPTRGRVFTTSQVEYELKKELEPAAGKPFLWLHEISYLNSKKQVMNEEELDALVDLFNTNYNVAVGILNNLNPRCECEYYFTNTITAIVGSNMEGVKGPMRKYLKEVKLSHFTIYI